MAFERISRFGIVNTFLLEEEDGLTVIDTMIGGSAKKILAAAGEPREQYGALEGPRGHFEQVTVEATQSEVAIEEPGWRLEHVRRRASSKAHAPR